jgi:hypothetical protein
MTLSSERSTVQNPLICYATEAGWTYLPPEMSWVASATDRTTRSGCGAIT